MVTSVVNRYYDPTTDQFLSIDPMVATTGQPYVFTNDNPLNATDPSGLKMCSSKQYPTELQMVGCETWTITSSNPGLPNSGAPQVANLFTTFGAIFGMTDIFGLFDGAAGVTDLSQPAKITSWSNHVEDQIVGRDGGRGVLRSALKDAFDHPLRVEPQEGGKFKYVGKNASVIVNRGGRVITGWARNSRGLP